MDTGRADVGSVMASFPKTLGPDATVQAAAQLLRDDDLKAVAVLDEVGSLIGLISDRDIVVNAVAAGHGLKTPIRDCMTQRPETIGQDTSVQSALQVMATRQVRHLPVMDNGRLVGMISYEALRQSVAGNPMSETPRTGLDNTAIDSV